MRRKKYNISEFMIMMAFPTLSNKEVVTMIGGSLRAVCHWRSLLGCQSGTRKFMRGKHKEKEICENYSFGWALGMFATDGSMSFERRESSTYKRVSLSCTLSDKDNLIRFFNVFLSDFSENDVYIKTKLKNTYATRPKASYVCSCPNFINLIEKYLIFNKKTYDLQINECFSLAPEEFKIGFLKGCIDGDGHVGKDRFGIDIVSASEKFILDLKKHFGGRAKKRKSGNYWDIYFNKEECIKLLEFGLINQNFKTLERKNLRLLWHYKYRFDDRRFSTQPSDFMKTDLF